MEAGTEHDGRDAEIDAFWEDAKVHARLNLAPSYLGRNAIEAVRPDAWAFGGTPEQADELLALVLDGTKTATASALWDYEAEDEPLPSPGAMSIVLDGGGHPRALLVTTDVRVVPFDEVDAEHARLEGEGDRSLAHWREAHERFFREHRAHEHDFAPDMPVVCERFEVVHGRAE